MLDKLKEDIEAAFSEAAESAKIFNQNLMDMRTIEMPKLEDLNTEERNELIKIGRDLDMRSAFLLRSLLVQHGNVLWI